MSLNKKKLKILIVGQHFWPESFRINDIAYFLDEKGADVDVLCGIPNYPSGRFTTGYSFFKNRRQIHKNINIRRSLEIPRGNNSNIRIFINYVSFPLFSLLQIPKLLTVKYDKIFIYQLSPVMMGLAGIIIGKIKRVEITMYVLDLWPENLYSVIKVRNRLLNYIIQSVSHWHYKKADKLIVLSEKMKSRLINITKISESKIIVLPQTCEKVYEETIYDKNIVRRFKNGFNIVYTGNISPAQSFETIIDAAKLIKKDGISDINWIIVGDGMSKKWLEQEIYRSELEDCFFLEGQKPINEIPKYTSVADLLIGCLVRSNLLEATIPAKVVSYLAAGKPIVLSMDGEVQKLINDTIKCGLSSPTENSVMLANNIKMIYNKSTSQRDEMGKRAKKHYLKHFERKIILNRLYSFIFN